MSSLTHSDNRRIWRLKSGQLVECAGWESISYPPELSTSLYLMQHQSEGLIPLDITFPLEEDRKCRSCLSPAESIVGTDSETTNDDIVFTYDFGAKCYNVWRLLTSTVIDKCCPPGTLTKSALGLLTSTSSDDQGVPCSKTANLYLAHIWRWYDPYGSVQVSSTKDRRGDYLFWFYSNDRLRAFGISPSNFAETRFDYQVLFAEVQYILRDDHADILMVQPDESLSLWTGYSSIIPFSLMTSVPKCSADNEETRRRKRRKVSSSDCLGCLSGRSTYKAQGPAEKSKHYTLNELQSFKKEDSISLFLTSPPFGISGGVRVAFTPTSSCVNVLLEFMRTSLPAAIWEDFYLAFFSFRHKFVADYHGVEDWDIGLLTALHVGLEHNNLQHLYASVVSFDEGEESWVTTWASSRFLDLPDACKKRRTLINQLLQKLMRFDLSSGSDENLKKTSISPEVLAPVVLSLHFCYEELRSNCFYSRYAVDLSSFVRELSILLHWNILRDYHDGVTSLNQIKSGDSKILMQGRDKSIRMSSLAESPPNFCKDLCALLQEGTASRLDINDVPVILNVPFSGSNQLNITRLLPSIFKAIQTVEMTPRDLFDLDKDYLALIPGCLSLGLLEILKFYRDNPKFLHNQEFLRLIGREDVFVNQRGLTSTTRRSRGSLVRGLDATSLRRKDEMLSSRLKSGAPDGSLYSFPDLSSYLLGYDAVPRLAKLMFLDGPSVVDLPFNPESSPEHIQLSQQEFLMTMSNGIFACSFGKSLAFYQSQKSYLPEILDISPMQVSAIMPPLNTIVFLEPSGLAPDFRDWPDFHHGVATALCLYNDKRIITNTWMLLNRPAEPSALYGGFMFGLGLLGNFDQTERLDRAEHFNTSHDITLVGLVLGLATSYKGRQYSFLTNILSVHIPSLKSPDAKALKVSYLLHSASLIGIGLNYMSSFSQKHLQAMLSELMSSSCGSLSPDVDITNGYEIQSVCSGFAVGMITLAKGHLINEKNDVNAVRINVVEDLVRLISARTQGQSSKHNAYHSPVGAIIAIMLMFLKSNDAAMAEELHLPQTLHLLDYSRYDVILLKTLGRNLIMWDSIEPADIWFCSQIPDYIKSLSVSSAESLKRGEYTFRDGAAASAYVESTRQAYLGILAGACLSLGLKLAGTACPIGFKAIMDKIRFVSKEINLNDSSFNARSRKSVARLSHDVMITAAAVIMAGTGNQELFNYIEKLMQTTYINASYGNYVACYSAMGFLFLGGGQYTFGSSEEAVVGLLMALYPRFPASPSDNRTHLEALRHMWILALESRCLVTRDIDSNAIIQLPMKVTCRNLSAGACRRYNDVCFDQDNITISLSTPCILPNMSSICGLKSETSKYWGIDFERRFEKQHQSMVFYLKSKNININTNSVFSRYPELLAIAQAKRRKLVENSQQVKSQLFWDNLNEYFAVPSANYNLSVEHFLRNKFKSLIWDSKSEEFSAFCEAELSEDPWMTYYFMRYCFSEFRMRLLGLERHQQ